MADGIIFEQKGVRAVSIITDAFIRAADAMARRYGAPGYRYAVLPHPVENLSREESLQRVQDALPDILSILGINSASPTPSEPVGVASGVEAATDAAGINDGLEADEVEGAGAAIERCYELGWSDGLPLVPPAAGRVRELIDYVERDPGEVLASVSHLNRACTLELAAANAVMAGCTRELFPVVLAALEALQGAFSGGILQSTTGQSQLVIVNGPIRQRLGFNSAGGVFGPGFRANATVGRALRLIIFNALGIRPQEFDQATQGSPGQYSFCIAENEEESPWEPLHVERGFAAEESTVTAGTARSAIHVENRIAGKAEEVLLTIADSMSYAGVWHRGGGRGYTVVLGPVHAQLLAAQGWSRARVKQFLWEHYGRRLGELRSWGPYNRDVVNRGNYEEGPDEHFLRFADSPDSVLLLVAGAANAGVSTVIPSAPRFTTKLIVEP